MGKVVKRHRYNLRKRPRVSNYCTSQTLKLGVTTKTKTNQGPWSSFNKYIPAPGVKDADTDLRKEWVSGTKVKNHILNDPVLDWLELYYYRSSVNTELPAKVQTALINKKKQEIDGSKNTLSFLFEMGNKFEDEVVARLYKMYPGSVKNVVPKNVMPSQHFYQTTIDYMMQGVPIIDQAMLYNHSNMSFGAADLIVRSDWINKIVNIRVLDEDEEVMKAPNLKGDYHYVVIDIKWTTMPLCSDGVHLRNSQRIPAYKGQLAIYNAAIGLIQGFTPSKAYVLAKSWKYTCGSDTYNGYNCFDRLGVIDYDNFDKDFLERTAEAIKWVRNVRYNGDKWDYTFPPTVPELYPNMNNQFDNPFHGVKKQIAEDNKELTSMYMVGVKHREKAHANGIFQWTDPKCTPKNIGINGAKVGPMVSSILNINSDKCTDRLLPHVVTNNTGGWQAESPLEFYVDFETINGVFYNKDINLDNCKETNNVIFMIGVGKVDSTNKWNYDCFTMDTYTLAEERICIQAFVDSVQNKVNKYNKTNKTRIRPSIMHWGHAERSMLTAANKRHNGAWTRWMNSVVWVDMCSVFKSEPIVIKGAKKFGLKEIAKTMKGHGMINTDWDADTVCDGLSAMVEACNYYQFMGRYDKMTGVEKRKKKNKVEYQRLVDMFAGIVRYNEVDCKTVYEIVDYLRTEHCE